MNILGMSGGTRPGNQDSAAVLVRDDEIMAAAEEERFLRIKHAPGYLPERAIRYCLSEAGLTIHDIDRVVFAGATYTNFVEILTDWLEFKFGHSPAVYLIDHHLAHAASAYYFSGFDEAMIFTADLSGDSKSTTLNYGRGKEIQVLREFPKPNSLGLFYSIITEYLGFQYDNDEYKVMGLASYARPTVDLQWVLNYDCDGMYTFNATELVRSEIKAGQPDPLSRQQQLSTPEFRERLGQPRRSGEPVTSHHEDVAASAQHLLNEVALALVGWLYRQTGSRNLCVAGGVGLNCVMNHKLIQSDFVDRMFIQPAANDAGLALGGAAYYAMQQGYSVKPMNHVYLGPSYDEGIIEKTLKDFRVNYSRPSNLARSVAEKLAQGRIIGWFQGRMEYGPRALGSRTILADPRNPDMKDKVNELIKFREEFRPFAPSVLDEHGAEFFVDYFTHPFMIITFDVCRDKQKVIPAVTHVDGTSRIHSVERKVNPLYYDMIREFHHLTGVPAVLNTSFNIKGQPIVCNPQQAISTFFGTGMDDLAIGPFLVQKG